MLSEFSSYDGAGVNRSEKNPVFLKNDLFQKQQNFVLLFLRKEQWIFFCRLHLHRHIQRSAIRSELYTFGILLLTKGCPRIRAHRRTAMSICHDLTLNNVCYLASIVDRGECPAFCLINCTGNVRYLHHIRLACRLAEIMQTK